MSDPLQAAAAGALLIVLVVVAVFLADVVVDLFTHDDCPPPLDDSGIEPPRQ